jgi:hypothetical protein
LQLATWLRLQGAAWPLCLWHTNADNQLLCWKQETFEWAVTAGGYPYPWREQWASSTGAVTAATATADNAAAAAAAAAVVAVVEPVAAGSSGNSSSGENSLCAALKAAGYEDVVAWVHALQTPPCSCVQSCAAAAAAAAAVVATPAPLAAAEAPVLAAAAAENAVLEPSDDCQQYLQQCSSS